MDTLTRDPVEQPTRPKRLQVMGPGLITGASDDDPSGIATYSQVGAQFGYGLAWTLLFSYPLMAAIQEISARVGRVTGYGIAGNLRRHYPRWLSSGIVGLLLIANIINLGADLGAMGAALKLLIAGPALLYVCLFGLLSIPVRIDRCIMTIITGTATTPLSTALQSQATTASRPLRHRHFDGAVRRRHHDACAERRFPRRHWHVERNIASVDTETRMFADGDFQI